MGEESTGDTREIRRRDDALGKRLEDATGTGEFRRYIEFRNIVSSYTRRSAGGDCVYMRGDFGSALSRWTHRRCATNTSGGGGPVWRSSRVSSGSTSAMRNYARGCAPRTPKRSHRAPARGTRRVIGTLAEPHRPRRLYRLCARRRGSPYRPRRRPALRGERRHRVPPWWCETGRPPVAP